METESALKQAEGRLMLVIDKITTVSAKLEELVFRAQRITASKKNSGKSTDTMFTHDLQSFRRDLRAFGHDIESLPTAIGSIERAAEYSEANIKLASAVCRCCDRLNKALLSLSDHALLAHHHIRESDAKIEAWYIVQEIGQLAEKGKSLPNAANKVLLRVGTPSARAVEPPK